MLQEDQLAKSCHCSLWLTYFLQC